MRMVKKYIMTTVWIICITYKKKDMVTSKSNSKSENIKREFPVFFIKPLTTPKNRESIASFLLEFTKSAYYQSKSKRKDDLFGVFEESYSDFLSGNTSDNLFDLYIACFETVCSLGFATNLTKLLCFDKDLLSHYKKIKNLELDEIVYDFIRYKTKQL